MSIDSISDCDHNIDPDDSVFLGRPDDFDENSPEGLTERMDILVARHAHEMFEAVRGHRCTVGSLPRAPKSSGRGKKSRKTR